MTSLSITTTTPVISHLFGVCGRISIHINYHHNTCHIPPIWCMWTYINTYQLPPQHLSYPTSYLVYVDVYQYISTTTTTPVISKPFGVCGRITIHINYHHNTCHIPPIWCMWTYINTYQLPPQHLSYPSYLVYVDVYQYISTTTTTPVISQLFGVCGRISIHINYHHNTCHIQAIWCMWTYIHTYQLPPQHLSYPSHLVYVDVYQYTANCNKLICVETNVLCLMCGLSSVNRVMNQLVRLSDLMESQNRKNWWKLHDYFRIGTLNYSAKEGLWAAELA